MLLSSWVPVTFQGGAVKLTKYHPRHLSRLHPGKFTASPLDPWNTKWWFGKRISFQTWPVSMLDFRWVCQNITNFFLWILSKMSQSIQVVLRGMNSTLHSVSFSIYPVSHEKNRVRIHSIEILVVECWIAILIMAYYNPTWKDGIPKGNNRLPIINYPVCYQKVTIKVWHDQLTWQDGKSWKITQFLLGDTSSFIIAFCFSIVMSATVQGCEKHSMSSSWVSGDSWMYPDPTVFV